MSIQPQHLLVEEKGLENQIKRLKVLVPTKQDVENDELLNTVGYLQTQLLTVIENLEHIQKKYSIGKPNFLTLSKHQDFSKLKDKFLNSRPSSSNG